MPGSPFRWLLPRFVATRIEEGQSRRNRIFGSIANYSDRSRSIKLPASNLLKGRIDKRNCGRFASSQLPFLSLLNSPLERYPFPRWLSTVCNKREIGEAEWRKGGGGREGRFRKTKLPDSSPSSPLSRFSSQGRDVCTWANSRCTVPFPRDINFSGSNLRHFSLPSTSPTSPRQRRSLAFSLSLYSSNGGGERCYF